MRPVRAPGRISVVRSSHIAVNVVVIELLAGEVGVDAVPEQQLGAVDVADAGEHALVHQQCGDRRPRGADALPRLLGIGIRAQRIGPEPVR